VSVPSSWVGRNDAYRSIRIIPTYAGRWNRQRVPKRWLIKFGRRENSQKTIFYEQDFIYEYVVVFRFGTTHILVEG
jgi:hypothetical protein